MKNKDVRVGMKVVPNGKSIGGNLYQSTAWNSAREGGQSYLYVIQRTGDIWMLNDIYPSSTGDFFLASDFEVYEQKRLIIS